MGDGKTEQAYLQHLKKLKGYKYSVYPSLFAKITHEVAENKIDELLSGRCDHIVYITDYDTVVNQNKRKKFDALKKKFENIDEVLRALSDREARVLKMRFGLSSQRPMTLEEVGQKFGVTRERIRQIEAKALRKLKHPSRRKKLQDYLD